MKIEDIRAREVLDSRGNPTIQVDCILEDGKIGRATVPSGASTGVYEAVELRDNDKTRYSGKGVRKAVSNVTNIIKRELVGRDIAEWESIDTTLIELDGTENKSNLGANAILGVSIAVIKAYSLYRGEPLYRVLGGPSSKVLPVPMVNILNGGVHADNNLDIQEFMIVPVGAPSFGEAIRYCVEVFHSLRNVLKERGLSTGLGDEGGFAPQLDNTREAIEIIISAIKRAGYQEGKDIALAVDVAASELLKDDGTYKLDGTSFNADSLIAYYRELIDTYPIVSIEDGLAEEDWDGWKLLCQSLGEEIQLVGDDIFVTNTNRIKRGIEGKIANAVLIKPNQIGTVSETISAIELAHNNHWKTVVSHRSGETEDVFIADLSVAMNTGVIKTGSVARSERVAKYNRLLQIEEELEGEAIFYGKSALAQERK